MTAIPQPNVETTIPTPTVERIPRTFDGSTWYAYTDASGRRIGATAKTRTRAMELFAAQWVRFGDNSAVYAREVWA